MLRLSWYPFPLTTKLRADKTGNRSPPVWTRTKCQVLFRSRLGTVSSADNRHTAIDAWEIVFGSMLTNGLCILTVTQWHHIKQWNNRKTGCYDRSQMRRQYVPQKSACIQNRRVIVCFLSPFCETTSSMSHQTEYALTCSRQKLAHICNFDRSLQLLVR